MSATRSSTPGLCPARTRPLCRRWARLIRPLSLARLPSWGSRSRPILVSAGPSPACLLSTLRLRIRLIHIKAFSDLGLKTKLAASAGDDDAAGPSIDDSTILFGPDAHKAPAPAPAAPSASNTLASLLASNSTLAAQLALSPG